MKRRLLVDTYTGWRNVRDVIPPPLRHLLIEVSIGNNGHTKTFRLELDVGKSIGATLNQYPVLQWRGKRWEHHDHPQQVRSAAMEILGTRGLLITLDHTSQRVLCLSHPNRGVKINVFDPLSNVSTIPSQGTPLDEMLSALAQRLNAVK